jgi:hypothetical protein
MRKTMKSVLSAIAILTLLTLQPAMGEGRGQSSEDGKSEASSVSGAPIPDSFVNKTDAQIRAEAANIMGTMGGAISQKPIPAEAPTTSH